MCAAVYTHIDANIMTELKIIKLENIIDNLGEKRKIQLISRATANEINVDMTRVSTAHCRHTSSVSESLKYAHEHQFQCNLDIASPAFNQLSAQSIVITFPI